MTIIQRIKNQLNVVQTVPNHENAQTNIVTMFQTL